MSGRMDYTLLDPTGNITILVETPVPAAQQPIRASDLMMKEPTAEQVGFVAEAPAGADYDIALRMAGGEFCGNATMSAAALWCADHGKTERTVRVRAVGAPGVVCVEISALRDGGYAGAVEMPRPAAVEEVSLAIDGERYRLPLVRFDGIAHLIVTVPMEKSRAERAVRRWCRQLGTDGLGLMLLDMSEGTLTPLVYVPAADTLFWESSCASGTSAVGAYLAAAEGEPVDTSFLEPGGILGVSAWPDGRITLRGKVKIVRRAR